MNLQTLWMRIRPRRPRLFAPVTDEQAVALLREALDELLRQMERIEDGCVPVYRFGAFHVRLQPDGRKHITFEPWEEDRNA